MYIFNKITVNPQLPKRVDKLLDIANNLWWSWNTEFLRLFKEIDSDLWDSVAKNPVKFLKLVSQERLEEIVKDEDFLKKFVSKLPGTEFTYNVRLDDNKNILVDMDSSDRGYLIGYRGEVLNSLQQLLNNIANKDTDEKTRVLLNIGGYKEKREKDLQDLADKIAGTVIKTKKSITLEPMTSYERKIIHTKLQENPKVFTHSIGEEPNRRLVVSLKK